MPHIEQRDLPGAWRRDIRHRRRASTTVVMRRLLSLDFVLEHPDMIWLPAEPEKVEFFEEIGLPLRLIPRRIFYGVAGNRKRYFGAQTAPCRGNLKSSPLSTPIRATRRIPNSTRGEPRMAALDALRKKGRQVRVVGIAVKMPSWTGRDRVLEKWAAARQGQAMN